MFTRNRFLAVVVSSFVLLSAGKAAAGSVPVVCGDATEDQKVTPNDALLALRAALQLDTCELCVCDVSGDGRISTTDAVIILHAATEVPVPMNCPECPIEPFCGDGIREPFTGTPFTGTVSVGYCEVFEDVGPNSPAPFDVRVTKALDPNYEIVTDSVSTDTYNEGCYCNYLPSRRSAAAGVSQVTTTTSGQSSTTSLDCSDCFFEISIRANVDLIAVEVQTDSDGLCDSNQAPQGAWSYEQDRPEGAWFRVHSLVAEECDDGNTESGDGCSADCRIEVGE